MCLVASAFINDDESCLHHDYEKRLEKLAPDEPAFRYRDDLGEDNANAPMKRRIMAVSWPWPGAAGFLDLGAEILRGVWRAQEKMGAGQDHRGVGAARAPLF